MSGQTAAIQALREYANAIRGDWGDIDGRSVKANLDEFADAIEGKGRAAEWTIEQHRQDSGLCPSGEGHWTVHCQPTKTLYAGTEDEYTYGCGNAPTQW